ncbi:hypothetical protein K525DRAFT_177292, partial [Schizophyllum commune Loenen D]
LGNLPPALALKLYKSCIDPILCFGSEIGTAISPASLHALEQVQLNFLRRILGLSKKSMCILPFTETGILPIRYRQLILALRFYKRLLLDNSGSIAAHAFQDACALYMTEKAGWLGDIAYALARL